MINLNLLFRRFVITVLVLSGFALLGTVVYAEPTPTPTPIVITITESISVSDQPPDPDASKTISETISVNDDSQVSGTPISEVINVNVDVTPIVESPPTPLPTPTATPTLTPTAVAVEKKLATKDEEFCTGRLNRDQKTACTTAVKSWEKCTGKRLSKEETTACLSAKEIVEACTDVKTREGSDICTEAMKSAETSKPRSRDDVFSRSAGAVTEAEEESAESNGSMWGIVYAIVAVIFLALVGMTIYRRKRSN